MQESWSHRDYVPFLKIHIKVEQISKIKRWKCFNYLSVYPYQKCEGLRSISNQTNKILTKNIQE